LSELEPELLHDAAPALMALAPTMVLNVVRDCKTTQNVTLYNPFSSYFQQ
jgi:hypothetical protein